MCHEQSQLPAFIFVLQLVSRCQSHCQQVAGHDSGQVGRSRCQIQIAKIVSVTRRSVNFVLSFVRWVLGLMTQVLPTILPPIQRRQCKLETLGHFVHLPWLSRGAHRTRWGDVFVQLHKCHEEASSAPRCCEGIQVGLWLQLRGCNRWTGHRSHQCGRPTDQDFPWRHRRRLEVQSSSFLPHGRLVGENDRCDEIYPEFHAHGHWWRPTDPWGALNFYGRSLCHNKLSSSRPSHIWCRVPIRALANSPDHSEGWQQSWTAAQPGHEGSLPITMEIRADSGWYFLAKMETRIPPKSADSEEVVLWISKSQTGRYCASQGQRRTQEQLALGTGPARVPEWGWIDSKVGSRCIPGWEATFLWSTSHGGRITGRVGSGLGLSDLRFNVTCSLMIVI